jgi:hypothetical protein
MLQHLYNLNNICISIMRTFFLQNYVNVHPRTPSNKAIRYRFGSGAQNDFLSHWLSILPAMSARCPVACTVRFRRDWVVLTEWWSGVKRLAQFPSVDAYTSPWSGNINIGSGNKVHTAVHLQPATKLWWVEKEELFYQSTAPLQGVSCAEHTPPATPLAD